MTKKNGLARPKQGESAMLARSFAVGFTGVDGYLVTVESDARLGLPGMTVVGLASGAVIETRERVRSAIAHCGFEVPPRKQVINLAPADRRKDSPGIDLAVACALLASHGVISACCLEGVILWGELGLDGSVRPAAGTLVVADFARQHGFRCVVVAQEAAAEAGYVRGIEVLPARNLGALIHHLRGEATLALWDGGPQHDGSSVSADNDDGPDMADVQGQGLARLALEVMVAGGHNLLLHGPPGVGKTMLARRAAGLFPDLEEDDSLQVTKIHSVASRQVPRMLHRRPPVRMPHHTVSRAGLLGGGRPIRPGEVSLAHRGLLFLDELLEFPRGCLEGLREPLEDGAVSVVRAAEAIQFPARFQLMAAMNPCPCGFLGHPHRSCVCSAASVARYQQRLSGPFLDRIDLVVPLSPPELDPAGDAGECSAAIRTRIVVARAHQRARLQGTAWTMNAEIPAEGGAMARLCPMTSKAARLLGALARRRHLSPRAQHRLIRVARTVAELRRAPDRVGERIDEEDMAQAALLRRLPELQADGRS